jgi:hypothetical protein
MANSISELEIIKAPRNSLNNWDLGTQRTFEFVLSQYPETKEASRAFRLRRSFSEGADFCFFFLLVLRNSKHQTKKHLNKDFFPYFFTAKK